MCYVFDTVLPSRQFDRTNPFHGDKELPLSESDDKDIVDVDGQGEGLMPCDVKEFSYVYFTHLKRTWLNDFRSIHLFQCEIFGHNFLSWAKGDTRQVMKGDLKTINGKPELSFRPLQVPAPL